MIITTIPGGGIISSVLASMLIKIYTFLYQPNDMMTVFSEFDEYIMKIYRQGMFGTVFHFFRIIGVGLLAVGFLVTLMDKVSEGDFSINNFFRHLLKYVMLYIILINTIDIFENLIQLSTAIMTSISGSITENEITAGKDISFFMLANGIETYMTILPKLGMFLMMSIPFVISVLFTIIIYFFSASRIMELSIRFALAPLVVGMSYFGNGANLDIVRYVKRTLGLFFQIVVILVALTGVTFVHNALISSNDTTADGQIVNPSAYLEEDDSYTEINVSELNVETTTNADGNQEISKVTEGDSEWKNASGVNEDDEAINPELAKSYTSDSIYKFARRIIDPSDYFISTGVMLAALFLIFKSRALSTELFL